MEEWKNFYRIVPTVRYLKINPEQFSTTFPFKLPLNNADPVLPNYEGQTTLTENGSKPYYEPNQENGKLVT